MTSPSRDRAETALRSLREGYAPFGVNQASVALEPAAYDTALEEGLVDAAIRIENDAGEVLAVEDDGWCEPRVRFDPDPGREGEEEEEEEEEEEVTDLLEAARSELVDVTGVLCRVEDLREVSVLAIHDETDPGRPPKFALDVRLSGRYEGGEPRGGLSWRDGVDE